MNKVVCRSIYRNYEAYQFIIAHLYLYALRPSSPQTGLYNYDKRLEKISLF